MAQWRWLFGNLNTDTCDPAEVFRETHELLALAPLMPNPEKVLAAIYDHVGAKNDLVHAHSRTRRRTAEFIAYCAAKIRHHHPRLVLDAACGTGLPLGYLASEFNKTGFIAYDVSQVAMGVTQARMLRLNRANVGMSVGSHRQALDLLKRNDRHPVDMVLCLNGYATSRDLHAFADCLRPGGMMILMGLFKYNPAAEIGFVDLGDHVFFDVAMYDAMITQAQAMGDPVKLATVERADPRRSRTTEVYCLQKPE